MLRVFTPARAAAAAAATAAAFAALVVAGAAEAQSSQTSIDFNVGVSLFSDPDTNAALGRLSANLTDTFGAEGELNIDLDDDFDTAWGLFGKAAVPVNYQFDVLGRLGYASAEGAGGGDDGGLAIGAGGQWMFDARNGVRFDYTRYDFGDDANALSVTYVRRLY